MAESPMTGSPENPQLSSRWGGLSPHLIASFYEVAKTSGNVWERTENTDKSVVKSPLTEASMEISLNWQSPFEQAGPESKAPALMAMLQTGELSQVYDSLMNRGDKKGEAGDKSWVRGTLEQFEGRTGITKLNSTQVFNGMPPVKIQVTAAFRAWSDPIREVEQPFAKLMEWALPIELSSDGSLIARGIQAVMNGEKNAVETLMPSKSPTRIAMYYKRRLYAPLVIEAISQPLGAPIDKNGRFTELLIPMTLCSLTALDRKDWTEIQRLVL